MNLEMYQNEIQKHLLNNVKNQMRYDARIKLGHAPVENKGLEIVSIQGGGIRGNKSGKNNIKTDVSAGYKNTSSYGDNGKDFDVMKDKFESEDHHYDKEDYDSDNGSNSDSDKEEVKGGKFNFVKSLKSVGKAVGEGAKFAGTELAKGVAKEGAKELIKSGMKYMSSAGAEVASEALPAVAEAAPVMAEAAPLLLAAGIKKEKKKRVLSEKQQRRNELVRKLMKEKKMSLAEASNHIKHHNLEF